MISQQQPSLFWSLTPNQLGHPAMCWMGDLSSELQSHSIDSRNDQSPKSELVHERKFIWKSPTQHMARWPNWLGIRLHLKQWWLLLGDQIPLFSKFIFSIIFCLTDLLSDLLIVKNPIDKVGQLNWIYLYLRSLKKVDLNIYKVRPVEQQTFYWALRDVIFFQMPRKWHSHLWLIVGVNLIQWVCTSLKRTNSKAYF